MECLWQDGSGAAVAVQAGRARGRRALAAVLLMLPLGLGGCHRNPVQTPVDWWHDLEGGEIAATRPPPPGADLPYPKYGTIPAKPPVLPSRSFRDTIENSLLVERETTQRLAARHPINTLPSSVPPPPPQLTPPPPAAPAVPGAPPPPESTTANATLPGADAPPAALAPISAPAAQAAAADGGPAPGTPVVVAGAAAETPGLVVPDAPPPPASFEGVPAQPAPTPPPPLPVILPPPASAGQVLFATGSATLDPSQNETLRHAIATRGKGHITIDGHGETQSDAPAGQEAALTLGLQRALAIATRLQKFGAPAESLQLSSTAFGRGATVTASP